MNIPVNTPLFSGNEKKYLNECIDTGWISSEGPFVRNFEDSFSKYIGRKYGTAVSNGSAALDIALKALDFKVGDEIIVPSFTIISPIYSILRCGAKPILIDSESETWNIDCSKIEQKITKHTRAILVVHIYGLPVDMNLIEAIASKYKLLIIEDAAEVHGLEYNNRKCGTFGIISTFSFYPNKHITTGEGGMIMTDDPDLNLKCNELRNLSFQTNGPRFVHLDIGWNYRMTNMQAAIGLAQLENIENHIYIKRKIGNKYYKAFSNIENIELPKLKTEYSENIFWVFGIICKTEELKNYLVENLAAHGIGTRPFFYPMHKQPFLIENGYLNLDKKSDFPVAEKLSANGFYLPSGLGLKEVEQDFVIEIFQKLINSFNG